MGKNQKSKRKAPRPELTATEIDPATGEDRRGEAVTVGWMLAMLATAAADVLAVVAAVVMPILAANAANPGMSLLLPRLMLFVASITGLVCILITPVVYSFRQSPPPLPITLFGITVSLLPVLGLFWSIWL